MTLVFLLLVRAILPPHGAHRSHPDYTGISNTDLHRNCYEFGKNDTVLGYTDECWYPKAGSHSGRYFLIESSREKSAGDIDIDVSYDAGGNHGTVEGQGRDVKMVLTGNQRRALLIQNRQIRRTATKHLPTLPTLHAARCRRTKVQG